MKLYHETLLFGKFLPSLESSRLCCLSPVGLGAPALARDFPGAVGLGICFCKAKIVFVTACVCDSSAAVRRAMTRDHMLKGCWFHEILLAKQEDVVCCGSVAASGGGSGIKKQPNQKPKHPKQSGEA